MTNEMWEKLVKDVFVYPGEKLDIRWKFDTCARRAKNRAETRRPAWA